MDSIFAPILNSTAGLTLTPEQWQRTGLKYFALDVLQLLQRPSYAQQVQIPGHLILDARNIKVSGTGKISYRGTDGAKLSIAEEELFEWMKSFQPDYIAYNHALPNGCNSVPAHIMISDALSDKAYHGFFLAENVMHSIFDATYQQDFQLLDKDCECESCQQGFTRAYLHHLIQHTPMLAQRYFMMHNMFVASRISKSIMDSINAL